MSVRDSKKRIVKDAAGQEYIFNLRRLYCSHCQKLHVEIPDFILPNKHYSRRTIESVLNGTCDYFAGDDRTITRWKKL